MEKEFRKFPSVKDWESEARRQIENEFSGCYMRVKNWNISDNDFYVISFVNSPYIYKVAIYVQEFIPDIADPIDADGYISVIRADMEDYRVDHKDFYFIGYAISYINS